MRKTTIAAVVLCTLATIGGTAASAEGNSAETCFSMAEKAKAAVENNQQSSNIEAATKEKNYGRDFCNNGLSKMGIEHYAQVLKLLGVS